MGAKAKCDVKTEVEVEVSKTSQYHCSLHELYCHVFFVVIAILVSSRLDSWACCLWVYYANI